MGIGQDYIINNCVLDISISSARILENLSSLFYFGRKWQCIIHLYGLTLPPTPTSFLCGLRSYTLSPDSFVPVINSIATRGCLQTITVNMNHTELLVQMIYRTDFLMETGWTSDLENTTQHTC